MITEGLRVLAEPGNRGRLFGDKGGYLQVFYTIRIKGYLDPNWSEWFAGLTIIHDPKGETVLAGPVRDQAA